MGQQERLFVVVDPTDENHVALERAIIVAGMREPKAALYVFIAVDNEAVDMRVTNDNLFRDQYWFDNQVRKPVLDAGLTCEVEISWSQDWQESIRQEAKLWGADNILIPVHKRTSRRRFTFSESKWDLLKSADCPVILVNPETGSQRKVILSAVNFQATRDDQKELNKRIIEMGRVAAENYDAELHVVNAYIDSSLYPDRGRLANETGLPAENIHVKQGYTDEVVSAVANELSADLAIIGTLGQTGKFKTRRGNTAERVIAGLHTDVLVINLSNPNIHTP
ncbi:MAG: universal stress protein [Pseudomonadales bacterium]